MLSVFHLIAGCALYGAIQQLQLSVAPPGRYSVVHLLLTLLWLLLGALSLLHTVEPAAGWIEPATLLKLDNIVRFLLWIGLIRLIAVYTRTRETLVPLTLTGIWLVFICFSLQTPLYGYDATAATGATHRDDWYAIHVLMLANVAYALHLCHRYYRRGHRTTARILSASLIAILTTTLYEMLAGLVAPPLPVIDVLGFLGFLLVVGFYLLPHYHQPHNAVAGPRGKRRRTSGKARRDAPVPVDTGLHAPPAEATPDALKAIGWYAEMGIRRLDRGADGPDKLAALFRKIRAEAASRLPPGSLER